MNGVLGIPQAGVMLQEIVNVQVIPVNKLTLTTLNLAMFYLGLLDGLKDIPKFAGRGEERSSLTV